MTINERQNMLRSTFNHLRRNGRWRLSTTPCHRYFSASTIPIDYYRDVSTEGNIQFGDFKLMASNSSIQREYAHVEDFGTMVMPGEKVWVRGRVSAIRRKGNMVFAVIRSKSFFTLQLCHFRDQSDALSKALIDYTADVPVESIVDVYGVVQTADVKSCTQKTVELSVKKLFVVSRAPAILPFSIEDASRLFFIYVATCARLAL